MKRLLACVVLLAAAMPATPSGAANSTDGSPPGAQKEGGIAGDPRGAIRALGGTSQTGFKEGGNKVDVPSLGGSAGAGRVGGAPADTSGR